MVTLISFVFPQFTIISLCASFLSWVDERNKLACSPCTSLHSLTGKALQRERGSTPFEAPKIFSGSFNCLNCVSTAMVIHSFHLYFRSSQFISLCVLFLLWVGELNKLACFQCMGPSLVLHSLAGRAPQRIRV